MSTKEKINKELMAPGQSPVSIIMSLMDKSADMDLDRVEKFLTIQKQWEADQAKKAYHQAMAQFKAEKIDIKKDKKVKYATDKGTTSYKHATLGQVTELINAALSKYDLSAGWELDQSNGIRVTCRITHSMGHSESTSLQAAADTSGGKNAIQALGSTISYLERYTLLALTGIATQDQDDDGANSASPNTEVQYLSEKQKSTIVDLVNSKEMLAAAIAKFFTLLDVDGTGDLVVDAGKIKASDFTKAMNMLRAVKPAEKKEG